MRRTERGTARPGSIEAEDQAVRNPRNNVAVPNLLSNVRYERILSWVKSKSVQVTQTVVRL
jgi:hypothetical protein